MSDTYFGMLGSMVFAGQAFGSFIASPVLQKAPPKYVLIICLMINVASLIIFTLTNKVHNRNNAGFLHYLHARLGRCLRK